MDAYKMLNLFWAIVWAVVLVLCVVGAFHKWAICIAALIAAIMVVMFVKDYVHSSKMK